VFSSFTPGRIYFSVNDVFIGWYEALQNILGKGNVAPFALNDRLVAYSNALVNTHETDEAGLPIVRNMFDERGVFLAAMEGLSHALYTFWPDVVLLISGFFMNAGTLQLIRQRRHKIVFLATESPYQDEEQLMRGQLADLVLLNDPVNLEMFREHCAAEYMPHAYRPALHRPRTGPRDPAMASDLCFIGTAFKSRIGFFEAMDLDGIDVLIGGNDWGKLDPSSCVARFVGTGLGVPDCVDNAQAVALYQHAKMGINFYRRETSPSEHWDGRAYAMGPREVEMAACGLPFLRDARPEGDEVLGMLPVFDNPVEASAILRWWLAHDAERDRAAALAREAVAGRTFEANARRLLALAEQLLRKPPYRAG
jgi:spore maturation protein CgeB